MSRPDGGAAAEARIPRAGRTVHRRSAPVALRVVSERVPPPDPGTRGDAGPPFTGGFAVPAGAAVSRRTAEVVPLVASGARADAARAAAPPGPPGRPAAAGSPPARPGPAPLVLARRTRRRRLAALMEIIRFRRGAVGRHRPDTTPSRGWSMFDPHRRDRRRFGVRR